MKREKTSMTKRPKKRKKVSLKKMTSLKRTI
jgi:hypothetical protein